MSGLSTRNTAQGALAENEGHLAIPPQPPALYRLQ
jgi:hypothetical protein